MIAPEECALVVKGTVVSSNADSTLSIRENTLIGSFPSPSPSCSSFPLTGLLPPL
jgi:hypothetical protein